MKQFSKDIDLLKYEPGLFTANSFAGQVLCRGSSGQLAGTTFTAGSEDFISKQVDAGHVIYLSDGVGAIDTAYEIVSVDSATQLTISVLRADPTADAIAIGTATNLFYRIGTFDALASDVLFELSQSLNAEPGSMESQLHVDDIVNPEALRPVSVFMILERVLAGLYRDPEIDSPLLNRRDYYSRLAAGTRQHTSVRFSLETEEIYEKSLEGDHAVLIRE